MVDRRSFTQKQRIKIFTRQNGLCDICKGKLTAGAYEIDHILALVHGGSNDDDNLRAVHAKCHRDKSNEDVTANGKVKRVVAGGTKRKGRPLPGTRASGLRKRMNGEVVKW